MKRGGKTEQTAGLICSALAQGAQLRHVQPQIRLRYPDGTETAIIGRTTDELDALEKRARELFAEFCVAVPTEWTEAARRFWETS